MDNQHMDEIVSLNADDLRVEELERRLEMALAAPIHLDDIDRARADNGCTNFTCVRNSHDPQGCSGFKCEHYAT